MAATVSETQNGHVVEVSVSEKLHQEDYDAFVPTIEERIREYGRIRLLFEMHDFHGWDVAALWEDIKFDVKHFNHFDRIAMVGEKTWEKWMSAFCKPITRAKVRYFDQAQKAEALAWLEEDSVTADDN